MISCGAHLLHFFSYDTPLLPGYGETKEERGDLGEKTKCRIRNQTGIFGFHVHYTVLALLIANQVFNSWSNKNLTLELHFWNSCTPKTIRKQHLKCVFITNLFTQNLILWRKLVVCSNKCPINNDTIENGGAGIYRSEQKTSTNLTEGLQECYMRVHQLLQSSLLAGSKPSWNQVWKGPQAESKEHGSLPWQTCPLWVPRIFIAP